MSEQFPGVFQSMLLSSFFCNYILDEDETHSYSVRAHKVDDDEFAFYSNSEDTQARAIESATQFSGPENWVAVYAEPLDDPDRDEWWRQRLVFMSGPAARVDSEVERWSAIEPPDDEESG